MELVIDQAFEVMSVATPTLNMTGFMAISIACSTRRRDIFVSPIACQYAIHLRLVVRDVDA